MNTTPISYKRHRFPPRIIAHAVWLSFRFPLSLRLVEEMLLERGIVVTYETICRWGKKFGPDYARRLPRIRAQLEVTSPASADRDRDCVEPERDG
jgi:putative transposase